MRQRKLYLVGGAVSTIAVLALLAGLWSSGVLSFGAGEPASAVSGDPNPVDGEGIIPNQPAPPAGADPLIVSYGVKFVCLYPIQAGTLSISTAPVVEETTEIAIHNPHNATVDVYKKAVEARFEQQPQAVPGGKLRVQLQADRSFRIDCDDIAKLLTNNPAATFIGTFGVGVKEEGYIVLHSLRPVDVTAQYRRGSEVLKKDITYQPWWHFWWFTGSGGYPVSVNPGHANERVIPVPPSGNFDCREALTNELINDVNASPIPLQEKTHTINALSQGAQLSPTRLPNGSEPPALVPLIGGCEKFQNGPQTVADVDYVLVSNVHPSQPNPITLIALCPVVPAYPWIYGRWSNLNVVVPNSYNLDLDKHIRDWLTKSWHPAWDGVAATAYTCNMAYFFPFSCSWGYWYWWWGGDDCIDIGVGEGESLDAEQVTPQRVFCTVFPPLDNDGDGRFDEDPPDGVNQDGDPIEGEDPTEC